MNLFLAMLAPLAVAAPDRVASTFAVGADVTDIVATEDGAWVGWTDASAGSLTVLDTGTFAATILTACTGAQGLAVTGDSTVGWTFLVGCDDGKAVGIDVTTDGDVSLGVDSWALGTGPVLAVEVDDTTVYGVVEGTDGVEVAAVALADGAEVSGYPVPLSSDTVDDTTLSDGYLVVAHGGDEVSKVITSSATVLYPQSSLGGRNLVDAYPYAAGSAVYLADSGGGLVRFQTGDNDYVATLTAVADTITALAIEPEEGWMVLGAGDDALLYDFSAGTVSSVGTIAGAANLTELVAIEGYALGTTEDGTVLVLTDRPWVWLEDLSPAVAVDGETVSLTFASDVDGTYEIRMGGTAAADGMLLGSGDVTADTSETMTFTVDSADGWEEGDNRVWVFVKDHAALVGRTAGVLAVDNPPGAVYLGASGVGFGNQSVTVQFDGISDADLLAYAIYVDIVPFAAADYPTGGPGFTGDDDITAPVVVEAEPGASVSRTLYPLTNGTTYYVAVRAYDEGGLEGPMSDVQSAAPEPTFSASQMAGDDSGYFPGICGFGGGLRAGTAGIALALMSLARRRRVQAGVAVLGALAIVPAAQAKADDGESVRTMNVQLRYGPTTIADPYVQSVFGTKANEILWFEYGYASRFVDANLGLGFYQEMGWLQSASGTASAEHDMITLFPVTLSVTGRLDLFDEQPIVPFGRVGLDYWMWRENWYVADADSVDDSRNGGKYGWHFGGGLMFLLDVFDQRAASRLDATTGINDTFLVAEYRKTLLIHGADQLNLSSDELTFGLKFDF